MKIAYSHVCRCKFVWPTNYMDFWILDSSVLPLSTHRALYGSSSGNAKTGVDAAGAAKRSGGKTCRKRVPNNQQQQQRRHNFFSVVVVVVVVVVRLRADYCCKNCPHFVCDRRVVIGFVRLKKNEQNAESSRRSHRRHATEDPRHSRCTAKKSLISTCGAKAVNLAKMLRSEPTMCLTTNAFFFFLSDVSRGLLFIR